jgi:DNA-directed RNA polymerase sigma subunit (sigma70/sigma32)
MTRELNETTSGHGALQSMSVTNLGGVPQCERGPRAPMAGGFGARLERAHELELTRRFHGSRDRRAADLLARAHRADVARVAWKFRHYGLPIEDLVAEGSFGVVHALERFEPERGVRFVTYAAHWIRACIIDHVLRSWSIVQGGGGALRSNMAKVGAVSTGFWPSTSA